MGGIEDSGIVGIRGILAFMVHAKKSLGQNFLNSKSVARDIVRAANLVEGETILEIGPGKGFLTTELLSAGAHVLAVEKDDRMIPLLQEKFAEEIIQKKFTLIHGDILEFITGASPIGSTSRVPEVEPMGSLELPSSYKLVANIPYSLTGMIIRSFLEASKKPERMVLMVQKEVAMRIVARDKKESILSIAVKVYGTPKLVKKVPARYFTPSPKVDSAILSIENISGKNFPTKAREKAFFEILHAGFAHKRKFLAGNLKNFLGDKTLSILAEAPVPEKSRAENLTLDQWLKISSLV